MLQVYCKTEIIIKMKEIITARNFVIRILFLQYHGTLLDLHTYVYYNFSKQLQ